MTGGAPSDIFGTIRTTGFQGADLYLLNPAGVLFGIGASVNVAGSFFVSTSGFLEFGNGARFNADRSPVEPQLAVVPPEAFGFLSNNPAAINVQNDSPAGSPLSFFSANPEETLVLIGGPVVIGGGILARSGSVTIVSSGSGGTARLEDGSVNLDPQHPGGPVTIQNSQKFTAGPSGGRAGDVRISGRSLQLIDTTISTNLGGAEEGDIAIFAQDTADLRGAMLRTISVENQSGDVSVSANRGITLAGSNVRTLIQTRTTSGQAGDVSISAAEGNLTVANSIIDAAASSRTAASINLNARNGSVTLGEDSSIISRTFASDAGDVTIIAREFTMDDGAMIEGTTIGTGRGANVRIEATEQVSLSGEGTLITTASGDGMQTASGRGGDVAIDTPGLEIRDGAEINANANSIGMGGDITVTAPEGEVAVTGVGSTITTASLVTDQNAGIAGPAGRIMIRAGRFVVSDGGEVSASTATTGAGGDVEVIADSVLLSGEDSNVAVDSQGTSSQSGDSGNLILVANDTLEIRNQAAVSADTLGPGAGGNVAIESPDIRLSSGGTISASTRGSGRGGNIEINGNSGTVSLSGPSTSVSSETTAEGDAGSVAIKTGRLTVRDGAAISASTSGNGKGGSVNIQAANIDLLNGGEIAARSTSTSDSAQSGSLSIRADEAIRIFNGSSVNVETAQADAGDIDLSAGSLLHLRDNSSITTSVAGGQGDGGNNPHRSRVHRARWRQ